MIKLKKVTADVERLPSFFVVVIIPVAIIAENAVIMIRDCSCEDN